MGKQYIEIYSGDTLLETLPSVSDYTIADQYSLIAYADGRADRTTVGSGAYMEVSGGTASETIIGNGGIMTVNSGKPMTSAFAQAAS